MNTLLKIAMANGSDQTVGLIEEVVKAVPEFRLMYSRTTKGTFLKTLVRTSLPVVGFRNANEGSVSSSSIYENRTVGCFILNPRWDIDIAVAATHEDGPAAAMATEAVGATEAFFQQAAKVLYYGNDATFGDAKGGPGLIHSVDPAYVIDAGGTTDNTASSLWAINTGPQGVGFVLGENGSMEPSEMMKIQKTDPNGNQYTAWMQEMLCHIGVQVLARWSCGRIKKLTNDAGKGLTDTLVHKLISTMPAGRKPNLLLATPRSIEQLRNSRTATNATGAPAPTPTEVAGIPLFETDSISNIETLAL